MNEQFEDELKTENEQLRKRIEELEEQMFYFLEQPPDMKKHD